MVNTDVKANSNYTFGYQFKPLEGFAGRQLGLLINVNYKDSLDSELSKTVFNETIKVIEDDSGKF